MTTCLTSVVEILPFMNPALLLSLFQRKNGLGLSLAGSARPVKSKKYLVICRRMAIEAPRGSFSASRRFHGTLFPVFIDERL